VVTAGKEQWSRQIPYVYTMLLSAYQGKSKNVIAAEGRLAKEWSCQGAMQKEPSPSIPPGAAVAGAADEDGDEPGGAAQDQE
jgi:hypothetical protein